MDWSPDRVLDFGPCTHRRGLKLSQPRRNLLWPVHAWRVVTPVLHDQPLNLLQRAVLRLQLTGTREHVRVGALLGIDPELVAFVAQELRQMDLLAASGEVTERGARLLEEAELGLGEMRVGWVFQDARSGLLLPRFVTRLEHADVVMDEAQQPQVRFGSKGAPSQAKAFVLKHCARTAAPPDPLEVLGAARRHQRQERRLRRAGLDLQAVPAGAIEQVSFVADEPEDFHLLTFAYVPEEVEGEEEPWYVADPFGFGASSSLRQELESFRDDAQGGLRELLDRITGQHSLRQRDAWLAMQAMIREEALREVAREWPLGTRVNEEAVRNLLVLAFAEIIRLEQEEEARRGEGNRTDSAYLKVRQALEQAVQLLRAACPPAGAWRKLYEGGRPLPRDAARQVVAACGAACGFQAPIPTSLLKTPPGKVQDACTRGDSSNLRPMCAALMIAAADDPSHPLRRLARASPAWLAEVDRIAGAAGAEVHAAPSERTVKDLRADALAAIRLCDGLLSVL